MFLPSTGLEYDTLEAERAAVTSPARTDWPSDVPGNRPKAQRWPHWLEQEMGYPDSDSAIGPCQVPECFPLQTHAIDREGNSLYHMYAITNLGRRPNQIS